MPRPMLRRRPRRPRWSRCRTPDVARRRPWGGGGLDLGFGQRGRTVVAFSPRTGRRRSSCRRSTGSPARPLRRPTTARVVGPAVVGGFARVAGDEPGGDTASMPTTIRPSGANRVSTCSAVPRLRCHAENRSISAARVPPPARRCRRTNCSRSSSRGGRSARRRSRRRRRRSDELRETGASTRRPSRGAGPDVDRVVVRLTRPRCRPYRSRSGPGGPVGRDRRIPCVVGRRRSTSTSTGRPATAPG